MPASHEVKIKQLSDSAAEEFPDPSEAEQKLLRAVVLGELAYCGPSDDDTHPHNNPDFADFWGLERDIRAGLIRWLCVNRNAAEWVAPRGIQVHAARINGDLELSFANVNFPLLLLKCRLAGEMILQYAQLDSLNLQGCVVREMSGDGLTVRGDIYVGDFTAEGEVRLHSSQVGGDLVCSGGKFVNPGGNALVADSAKVTGNVYLDDGFSAQGEVRMIGAQIGGTLDCIGGKFVDPQGAALSADRVRVMGDFNLRDGFSAVGEVRLLGARVGGNLVCRGGTFVDRHRSALTADGVRVTGGVFLRDGFSAVGEVRLLGARVGGDLDCTGGKFVNPSGNALTVDRARITSNVNLRDGFSAEGEVCVVGAQIEGDLDCSKGQFVGPGGYALVADGVSVTGSVYFRDGFSVKGEVRLPGAQIGGGLDCGGAKFTNKDGSAISVFVAEHMTVRGAFVWCGIDGDRVRLDLGDASVGPIVDDAVSWPEEGKLTLEGFIYTRFAAGPRDAKSRLQWLDRQAKGKFIPQPYQQLAKVLREDGDIAGANQVLIEMENRRYLYGNLGFWSRKWQWILGWTIGYGYRPACALVWAAIVVLFIGLPIFYSGYCAGAITPTDKDAYAAFEAHNPKLHHGDPPAYYSEFSPVMYSLDNFLPIINFGEKDEWRPNPHDGVLGEYVRIYLWIHIALGWLLTTLFVAGLTPLVRNR